MPRVTLRHPKFLIKCLSDGFAITRIIAYPITVVCPDIDEADPSLYLDFVQARFEFHRDYFPSLVDAHLCQNPCP